jgi:hypothetical protein
MALRWVLFVFFLSWVPAVFAIAREFCAPWPAAGITVLSVLWSVPNYPAAMPSWYCLFFATFGVLALLRYLCTPHPSQIREFRHLLAELAAALSPQHHNACLVFRNFCHDFGMRHVRFPYP